MNNIIGFKMDEINVELLRNKIITDLEQSSLYFHIKNKFYKMLNSHFEDFYIFIDGVDNLDSMRKEDIDKLIFRYVYSWDENQSKINTSLYEGSLRIVNLEKDSR